MGRPRRSVWEKDHLTNRTRNALEKAHIYDYDQLGGVIASGEKIKGLGVECVDELNRHLKKWKIGVNSQATRFWIIDCTTKRPILDIAAYEKTLAELAEKNGLRNMTALSNYLTDKVGKPFCPSFLANSKRTDTGNRGLTEWEVYMMKKVVGLTYDPTEATGIFASEPGGRSRGRKSNRGTTGRDERSDPPAEVGDRRVEGSEPEHDDNDGKERLMNITIHTGRLGADPELRKTNNGKSVVNVSVAVYAGKSQNGDILTDWFRWTIWGDQADRFAAKARKGDAVMMKGRATVKAYQKDGQEVKAVEFIADDYMIQKKEMQAAVVTSVKPQEYSFPDFPNDEEPLPWQ